MNTVKLAFNTFGDSANPVLIIAHGFFASSRNWRQVAMRLADQFYVYTVDLRNHGESPHHPIMDYPAMAQDLSRFMDEQALETAHILGHSMGGKVAMWMALNYPERLDSLIVVDISPVSYTHSFDVIIKALQALPLAEIGNRKQADDLLAESIEEASFRQFLLQNLVLKEGVYYWRINLDIFADMAANIIAFPDSFVYPQFGGKALFIGGNNSDYIQAEEIKKLFPTASIEGIENAGHWLHVEQPDILIRQVEKVL